MLVITTECRQMQLTLHTPETNVWHAYTLTLS